MARVVVTPEAGLADALVTHRPSHAACFGSPSRPAVAPDVSHVLLQSFHDIAEPRAGHVAPTRADADALIAFLRAWDGTAPLLLQCWMGVSRSTAALLIAGTARGADPAALARTLRERSPAATPNPLMVAHADDALALGGRLRAAAAAIGRGTVPVAEPFALDVP